MNKTSRWIARGLMLASVAVGGSALASPITFTFTGTGSGTLNNVAFGSSTFTITENDDTALRGSCGSQCFFIDDTVATINISGVGDLTFVTGTHIFANGTEVGFSRGSGDLYDTNDAPAFTNYDLTTALGPVPFDGTLFQWTNSPVVTSGGVLVFDTGRSAGTFEASIGAQGVPEPESVLLVAVGLLGLAIARRHRR